MVTARMVALGRLEGSGSGRGIAGGERVFELAQIGAHARPARPVDLGAALDLADLRRKAWPSAVLAGSRPAAYIWPLHFS